MTDARFTGIDHSAGAIRIARSRHLGSLRGGSRFETGSFDSTGVPDGFADGVMSTDALFYAQDQPALIREIARIGNRQCRVAFTGFELRSRSLTLGAGPVSTYRSSLESAGFEIDAYEEAPYWEPRMRAVFSGILERREKLEQEFDESVANGMIAWATQRPSELSDSRRVLVTARRAAA